MNTDRNLLLGILSLQLDFITRDQLVKAMHDWVLTKSTPLGQILVTNDALNHQDREIVELVVDRHIELHGADPEKSLASIGSISSLRDELVEIGSPELSQRLSVIGSTSPHRDLEQTAQYEMGESTSHGTRFRVLRHHAAGGLGEVSVAFDKELNREVALKRIKKEHSGDQNSRARFTQEAEITGGLEHPGIVPVYGLGHYSDGQPFYAMRFIRGGSLKEAIQDFHSADDAGLAFSDRSLRLRKLLGRLIDVSNAIQYAHSRGVLHRDLKPGNVMLGKYGETLVVDWGLAKPVGRTDAETENEEHSLRPSSGSGSEPTEFGVAIGTPAYMSPEQAAGRLDELGPRSDVYSLGATLYSILAGRSPFSNVDKRSLLTAVKSGNLSRPSEVKRNTVPELEAICLKAMALKPADRYSSPNELAEDLEHWLADEPVTAYRDSLATRLSRWGRRHKATVAGFGALLLTATISLGIGTALLSNANSRTEEQRQVANHNYRVAHDAVDKYYRTVSQQTLLNEPGLQPVRKELLELALDYYQQFVEQRQNDPSLETDIAQAHIDLSRVQEALGLKEALQNCEKGLDIYRKLVALDPGSADIQSAMARGYSQLAGLKNAANDIDGALKSIREAQKIQKELVAHHPTTTSYQDDLGRTYANLGNVHFQTSNVKAARQAYVRSVEIRQQVVADNPDAAHFLGHLARSYHTLGILQMKIGEWEASHESFQRTLDIWLKLDRNYSGVIDYQYDISRAYGGLGYVHSHSGDPEDALEYYRRARKIQEKLIAENPTVTSYQNALGNTYNHMGILQVRVGNAEEGWKTQLKSVEIVEKLAINNPTIALYQRNLALAYIQRGFQQTNMGDLPASLESYQRALEIQKKLFADHPAVVENHSDLVKIYNNLASVQKGLGDRQGALESCQRAMDIQEKVAADNPTVPEYRHILAVTYNSLGALKSNPFESISFYQKAVDIQEKLVADDPTASDYQHVLGMSYDNLALTMTRVGDQQGAKGVCEKAVKIREELAAQNPSVIEYQVGLARSYNSLGLLQGEPKAALELHNKAIGFIDDVLTQNRKHPEAIQELINALEFRTRLPIGQEQFDSSIADWDQILDVLPKSLRPRYVLLRSLYHAKSGDHKKAVADVEELVGDDGEHSGTVLYNAACVVSQSRRAATENQSTPEEESMRLSDNYANRAIDLLLKAKTVGFFDDPATVKKLETDTDLDPIRNDRRFKLLVEDLKSEDA